MYYLRAVSYYLKAVSCLVAASRKAYVFCMHIYDRKWKIGNCKLQIALFLVSFKEEASPLSLFKKNRLLIVNSVLYPSTVSYSTLFLYHTVV